MGWTISHGITEENRFGLCPSYTGVSELADDLKGVLPGADWRIIRGLFNRKNGEPFTVTSSEAGRMAVVFQRAAGHPRMAADGVRLARKIAAAADRAARTGQSWRWS